MVLSIASLVACVSVLTLLLRAHPTSSTGMASSAAAGSSSIGNVSGRSGHVPLDVDGYPIAPPELELEQVHIYVRHGERAPVGARMIDPPASLPKHWMFCHTARQFRAAVASGSLTIPGAPGIAGMDVEDKREESLRTHRVVERADGTVVPGECLLGELTDVGRQTTYDFGHTLRRLYIDSPSIGACVGFWWGNHHHRQEGQLLVLDWCAAHANFRAPLGFLPDTAKSNDEVYLRSTNVPRTIESLQQITHGLYPEAKSAPGFIPQIRIRNGKEENLCGNAGACKRLEVLQIGFAKAAAADWNATLAQLDAKLSKYIGGNPVRVDGKPRASGILDTFRAADAHGITLPPEFREEGVMDLIEKAVVHEWFADKTEEVRRLGMGPLLSDLSRKMQQKAVQGPRDPLKILVHSTHDTSIAAIRNTLDVFDDRWPAFSSSITFELFRKREEHSLWQIVLTPFQSPKAEASTEHYVRMRYQNENLRLPACAAEGKHLPGSPEFCTLAAFRERVAELTPVDWEVECSPVGSTRNSQREIQI